MMDAHGFERTRINSVKEITVVCVNATVGDGTEENPVRDINVYYSPEGERLAIGDPETDMK